MRNQPNNQTTVGDKSPLIISLAEIAGHNSFNQQFGRSRHLWGIKYINQAPDKSHHQSNHRQKSPFLRIKHINQKPINQSFWHKSPFSQTTGKRRHQSNHRRSKDAIHQTIGRSRHQSNHRLKSASIKSQAAKDAINQITSGKRRHQSNHRLK